MTILGKRAIFETIRFIDSSTFSGSYQVVGTVLSNPSVFLKLVNNSGVLVTVSFDGVHDHDVLPGGTYATYDFGSDAQTTATDKRLSLAQGTQVWAKGTTSTGLFYAVTVYQGG